MDTKRRSSPGLLQRSRSLILPGLVLLAGCQVTVGPRDPEVEEEIHSSDDLSATTQQIRLRMRSLVDPFSGEIESAADGIIAGTTDPEIRRAALEWKTEAVPAVRESLFQPAPLTALFDTWVLTNQMAIYFSSGPGARNLGPHARTAAATSMKLERDIREVARSFTKSGEVEDARKAARDWAAAHPITSSIAHRESTLSRSVQVDSWNEFIATETLGSMTMSMDDLNRKLEVYTDQLFRQVRWEGQLLTMDLAEQFKLGEAMPLATEAAASVEDLSVSVSAIAASVEGVSGSIAEVAGSIKELTPLVERLIVVTEDAPTLIARERAEVVASVNGEVTRALQFVTAERLAALQAVHETVAGEREILTRDLELLSTKAIDHAFWRATQLVAGVVLVLLLAGLVALRMIRSMLVEFAKEGPPA